MTDKERQERLASDLKNAVVHEVGHAVYSLRSGCDMTFVEMWLNPDLDTDRFDVNKHKIVLGQHKHDLLKEVIDMAALGYAGIIAEYLGTRDFNDNELYELVCRQGAMSDSDMALTRYVPPEKQREAFDRALTLIKLNWSSVTSNSDNIGTWFIKGGMQRKVFPIAHLCNETQR